MTSMLEYVACIYKRKNLSWRFDIWISHRVQAKAFMPSSCKRKLAVNISKFGTKMLAVYSICCGKGSSLCENLSLH